MNGCKTERYSFRNEWDLECMLEDGRCNRKAGHRTFLINLLRHRWSHETPVWHHRRLIRTYSTIQLPRGCSRTSMSEAQHAIALGS
jgi:hypothetical protein